MTGLTVLLLLGAAVCGAQPRGRILGGQEAEAHVRPYMASVQVDGRHLCGGVLVAAQWVLSAAHCLEQADGKVQVLLGAHSLSQPEPSKRLYHVSRSVPHPDSSPNTIDHDLLLLQLSEKAVLGPAVQILPLQTTDRDVAPGTLCDVAGWGVVSHSGRRPDRLQHVSLPVLDRGTCNQRRYHDGAISERMMCAESQRRDSCKAGVTPAALRLKPAGDRDIIDGNTCCSTRLDPWRTRIVLQRCRAEEDQVRREQMRRTSSDPCSRHVPSTASQAGDLGLQ